MAEERIADLLRVENRLTRSFIGYIVALLTSIIWLLFVARPTPAGGIEPSLAGLLLVPLQLGFYLWYAMSAGAAAKVLGDAGWKYVVWILVSPFLALIPIPIVSTIIAVSPLSIKFLLGGQLQTAIRDESMAQLHHTATE